MTDSAQRKNRRQLLMMFGIAFLTLGASYVLFYMARSSGVWGTTNYGTFVDPPRSVADLQLTDERGQLLTEGGTWWLWVVAPEGCAEDCETAVHQLRQLHVLLNKDADRVQRALLTRQAIEQGLLGDYPRLEHLTGSLEGLREGVYIVDPIGNLVLFYPLSDAGKPVLEDLKKLLKLSQIG
jgi:cytochrome oxidase Cu insertion factor (SCO1/SenC/PrrC family)